MVERARTLENAKTPERAKTLERGRFLNVQTPRPPTPDRLYDHGTVGTPAHSGVGDPGAKDHPYPVWLEQGKDGKNARQPESRPVPSTERTEKKS